MPWLDLDVHRLSFSLLGAKVTVFDLTPEQLEADPRAADHYGYTVETILVSGSRRAPALAHGARWQYNARVENVRRLVFFVMGSTNPIPAERYDQRPRGRKGSPCQERQ